jgi:hypothetical protein
MEVESFLFWGKAVKGWRFAAVAKNGDTVKPMAATRPDDEQIAGSQPGRQRAPDLPVRRST